MNNQLKRRFTAISLLLIMFLAVSVNTPLADPEVPREELSEDELAMGEDCVLPMDPLAFFEAKAEAGGVAGDELEAMARAMTGQHLDWIVNALEAYAAAHGGYPQHINQLLMEPGQLALPAFYPNPWTSPSIDERDALELPYGWTPLHPGNFSYLQYYAEDGSVRGYILLGWGADPAGGMDISGDGAPDGVVSFRAGTLDKYPDGPWIFYSGGREIELDVFAE